MVHLTPQELGQIQRRLTKRLKRAFPQLLAVGFGTAYQGNRRDASRGFVVTFFVGKKLKGLSQKKRLPKSVSVRLERGGKVKAFHFPTDVVEQPQFYRTGREVWHQQAGNNSFLGTVGAVVRWRTAPATRWDWGLLSVGHIFPAIAAPGAMVQIFNIPKTSFLNGTVLFRTTSADPIDGGLVAVTGTDLVSEGIIADLNADPEFFWSKPQLLFTIQKMNQLGQPLVGTTHPSSGAMPFSLDHYLAETPDGFVTGMGPLTDVLIVNAQANGAPFFKGSSGSCWQILAMGAALQVGADPGTFATGIGQILEPTLDFVMAKLAAILPAAPTDVQSFVSF